MYKCYLHVMDNSTNQISCVYVLLIYIYLRCAIHTGFFFYLSRDAFWVIPNQVQTIYYCPDVEVDLLLTQ